MMAHRRHNLDPLEAEVGAGAAALASGMGVWVAGKASVVVVLVRGLGDMLS